MVTILKRGANGESIRIALAVLKTRKGLDAWKYCGVISLKEDALKIQKKLRNEWR